MADTLERQEVVDLLNRLGSEQDEDVLAAARSLHTQLADSGMSWEELLVPEGSDEEPESPEPDDDEESESPEPDDDEEPESPEPDDDEEPESPEPDDDEDDQAPLPPVGDGADTLVMIETLLARPGNSDDFREELEGYKSDIAEGEFEKSDHRYVRALYARLSKS